MSPSRVESVCSLERSYGHAPVHLWHVALSHRIIEVAVLARAEHYACVVLNGSLQSLVGESVAPSEGDASRLNLLEVGLIPEHRSLVIGVAQEFDNAVEHISLKLPVLRTVGSCDAEFLLQSLAFGAVGPAVERRIASLIASEVDIFRREYVGNLLEHIAQELVSEVVARAKKLVGNTTSGADRHLTLVACKFGEYADSSYLMSGHLNFGHNLNMILCGELHQVAHLLLSVIALVRHQQVVLAPT